MVEPAQRHEWKKDLCLLVVLMALVVPVRAWLLFNTEVAARDSIGYIRYALQFETIDDWREVLKHQDQHPGYPVSVWAVSQPVRWYLNKTDADVMRLCAQLASTLAGLLLMAPMYHLGRVTLGRGVGFVATLLFQLLPTSGQALSDAISEPLFLLFLTSALYFGVEGIRMHSMVRLALMGALSGLAYLTRPEGALVLPAFAVAWAVQQCVPGWRMTWARWCAGATLALAGAILVGSIYVWATGRITRKLSPQQILDVLFRDKTQPTTARPTGMFFAVTFAPTDRVSERARLSAHGLFTELNKGFHYLAGIPALLGVWWSARRLGKVPGFSLLAVWWLLHASILVALGMVVFYVSERHVLPMLLLGCYSAALGILELPGQLQTMTRRLGFTRFLGTEPADPRRAHPLAVVLVVAVCAFGAPVLLQRLHGNRVGNHAAGRWLAEHLQPGDIVLDDHGWSHYYSGLLFAEGKESPIPAEASPRCFVVITRSRDAEVQSKRVQKEEGQLVYHWPPTEARENARVVVFEQPRRRESHPWVQIQSVSRTKQE